jgi:hypothetical protein
MTFRGFARLGAILTVAVLIPACDKFAGFFVPFPGGTVVAGLSGAQVVPAVTTTGAGTATLSVTDTSIDFLVTHSAPGTVTAVRIHDGSAGTNGPALFSLGLAPFSSPLAGTLTVPLTGNFSGARDRILNGNAYIVITTSANPLGELRGQLGAATLASAKLSGAQVPVAGTGSGTATFQLNSAQDEIVSTVTFTGLTGATTFVRVRVGAPGVVGPTIFTPATGAATSPLVVALNASNFTAGGAVTTFPEAVNAFLSGQLYVEIETGAPEIRGQIGPVQLIANLDETQVVNPSGSPNTGVANVVLNGAQTAVNVILNHTVTGATNILIQAAAAGVNGPQIFDVDDVAGTAISPVQASLTEFHLFPQAVQSIFNFADAVDALIVGRTYIDVFSSASTYPDGEIRGQIGP